MKKNVSNNLGESREDYLEAILILINTKKKCKSIDIANFLNLSKPSVSIAIKSLIDDMYVEKEDGGYLILSDKGNKIANKVYERHNFFTTLLKAAKVRNDIAEIEACKMEHVISDDSFIKLKKMLEKIIVK